MFAALLLAGLTTQAGAQEFTIVYTNSANGAYRNCLCPEGPLGGLEKRSLLIAEIRKRQSTVVVLDNGDNFIEFLAPEISQLVSDIIELIDYDVINTGDQDIAFAPPGYFALDQVLKPDEGPVELKRAGLTISILPVMHPRAIRFYTPEQMHGLQLPDIDERIAEWLATDNDPSVFHILLSHAGFEADKKIARQYPAIELIVGGHSQTLIAEPAREGLTFIVQAGGKAGYVGEISFELAEDGFKMTRQKMTTLTPDMPDDPVVMEMIRALGITGH